jgi:hypothetical protein
LLLRATRFPSSEAFECFDSYAIGNAQNASRDNLRYLLGMNGFLIVVPWKQDLQEIVTDLGYRPFRGQIGPINIVDAADIFVRFKNIGQPWSDALFHRCETLAQILRCPT